MAKKIPQQQQKFRFSMAVAPGGMLQAASKSVEREAAAPPPPPPSSSAAATSSYNDSVIANFVSSSILANNVSTAVPVATNNRVSLVKGRKAAAAVGQTGSLVNRTDQTRPQVIVSSASQILSLPGVSGLRSVAPGVQQPRQIRLASLAQLPPNVRVISRLPSGQLGVASALGGGLRAATKDQLLNTFMVRAGTPAAQVLKNLQRSSAEAAQNVATTSAGAPRTTGVVSGTQVVTLGVDALNVGFHSSVRTKISVSIHVVILPHLWIFLGVHTA